MAGKFDKKSRYNPVIIILPKFKIYCVDTPLSDLQFYKIRIFRYEKEKTK